MADQNSFNVTIEWQGSRLGLAYEGDFSEIEFAPPPMYSNGITGKWTPEHFLVASVNSCLMTTFLSIASNSNLEIADYISRAEGFIKKDENKFMFEKIIIKPKIRVVEKKNIEKANRLIHKAEEHCLISNSLKAEVILQPEID